MVFECDRVYNYSILFSAGKTSFSLNSNQSGNGN